MTFAPFFFIATAILNPLIADLQQLEIRIGYSPAPLQIEIQAVAKDIPQGSDRTLRLDTFCVRIGRIIGGCKTQDCKHVLCQCLIRKATAGAFAYRGEQRPPQQQNLDEIVKMARPPAGWHPDDCR